MILERPLCIATVFYILGIIMGLYLDMGIVLFCAIFFIIIILFFCVKFKILNNKEKLYKIILFVFMLVIGFASIKNVDRNYFKQYSYFDEGKTYKIQGVVISDAKEKEYKNIYEIRIEKINSIEKEVQNKIWLLNVKNNKDYSQINLNYGDEIEFIGNIEIPSIARNYMGFDYQEYLKSQEIYGTIEVVENLKVIKNNKTGFLENLFYNVRKIIKEVIYNLLPEGTRELCVGILIGDRRDIQEDVTNAFKESNLTHMLAISGAHISYIILAITKISGRFNYRFTKVFTIIFLIFFIGVTDFTPSVQRASIMSILIMTSSLLYRNIDIYTNLAFSALIILFSNPYSILNIGFLLSYGGTIGIILFTKRLVKYVKWDLVSVTLSANIVIIPIMAFKFNTVSLTFWISNILASPFLGIIIILGFLMCLISVISIHFASIIAFVLNYIIKLLVYIAEISSTLPLSTIIVTTPSITAIIFYYLIVLGVCNYEYSKNRIKLIMRIIVYKIKELKNNQKFASNKKITIIIVFTIFVVLLLGLFILANSKNKLKIHFIDVGQGDCTLICTPQDKCILIDGGGSETGSFDIGEQTLFPYLLDRGIKEIDYMIISHFDSDHVGGLLYILKNMKVNNVIISKQGEISENYKEFKNIVKEKSINVIMVEQGNRIYIEQNIYFDILFPNDNLILENVLNNNSIVAKLYYNNFSMLFTGDIEEIAEKELINTYKESNVLNSTILKIAHHGSKSSSIQEILNCIKPKIALIGVGKSNTFGHPNSGVLNRLSKLRYKNI